MEKVITIDGQKVKFKSNASTPLRYKAQFGKDYFKEILKLAPLAKAKNKKEITTDIIAALDFEIFYNIAWIMAKTADPTIPEPLEWLDQFEEFPMAEIIPELQSMVASNFRSTKKK
jgi:hypothetical protein